MVVTEGDSVTSVKCAVIDTSHGLWDGHRADAGTGEAGESYTGDGVLYSVEGEMFQEADVATETLGSNGKVIDKLKGRTVRDWFQKEVKRPLTGISSAVVMAAVPDISLGVNVCQCRGGHSKQGQQNWQ